MNTVYPHPSHRRNRWSPHRWPVVALALVLAGIAWQAPALTEADLYRVFDEQNISYDAAEIERRVVDGILSAVDPLARILSSNDVAELDGLAVVVTNETLGQGIRHLKLNGLFQDRDPSSGDVIREWASQEASGFVLDLRGAGGQDLAAVSGLAALFNHEDDPLFEVADKAGQVRERFRIGTNRPPRLDTPLMILVNGETRGASEVLAAVLHGQRGVVVLGSRTHGHTGVMEAIPVTADTSLYLATGWVSLGHKDQAFADGVSPDIAISNQVLVADVELPRPGKELEGKRLSEKARLDRSLMERVSGDPVLRRATDVLLALGALQSAGAPPEDGAARSTP